MVIDIVSYDELTPSQKVQAISLGTTAFGGSLDISGVQLLRQRGGSASGYYAMYAVEDGEAIGQVVVYRIDYSFPYLGTRKVSGLAGITTRADKSRKGVARRIIEEVHERERREGITHSMLWTNSSWHAHDLYLSLGYRDIFSSPLAFKSGIRTGGRIPYTFTTARKSDLGILGDMHSAYSKGGTGFVHRSPGLISVLVQTGEVVLKNIQLIKYGDENAGYMYAEKDGSVLRCRELVILPGKSMAEIVEAVESRVKREGVAMFRDMLTPGTTDFFRSRGYMLFPAQWKVLMGKRLDKDMEESDAITEFGTARTDFFCSAGDGF